MNLRSDLDKGAHDEKLVMIEFDTITSKLFSDGGLRTI